MNKLFILILAVPGLLCMAGCSTKFNIAAPYKNVTVVYGYLDQADTAHYIRIQKAFLSQNLSALAMAQTPDSSYYASLNVRMELLSVTDTNVISDTIHLNRVDLDLEGYPKQPGQFFQSPNYAYKFKNALDPSYMYRLVITNPATGEVDSAETFVIDDVGESNFYVQQIDSTIVGQLMDFSSTLPNASYQISGSYNPGANFPNTLGNPAAIGQTLITFNWADSNGLTHALTQRSYTYDVGYFYPINGNFDLQIPDASLYDAVATALGTAPINIYRLLGRVNLTFYLGSQDFSNYLQYSLTQGIGLTGSQIEPVYSNLHGATSIGLFTARAMRSGPVTMNLNTIDSLIASPMLSGANIAGTEY